jgi:predicted ATPase
LQTKKIVITGGPGTGKSSVISELIKRGFFCLEEISRQITREARKDGTEQLFLKDPLLFSEKIINARQQQYLKAKNSHLPLVFFDRGMPDVLAYMDFIGDIYPSTFNDICLNHYYDEVFVLAPWKEIFKSDAERYENFEQAVQIHDYLLQTYQKFNYKLIDVPFAPVDARVDYILNEVENLK